eukprot:1150779-Pelagomonas_calceolata.AAC.1
MDSAPAPVDCIPAPWCRKGTAARMSTHILAGLAALPARHSVQQVWHSLALSANLLSKSSSTLRCSLLDEQQLEQQQGEGPQQGAGSSAQLACPGDGSRLLSSWHASTSSRCSRTMHHHHHHHHHHQSSRGFASSSTAAPQKATQQQGSLPGWVPFTPNPAVKPRKPEDIVGEESWLLKHFKRNMHPRQLVHRLAKRTTPQAMLVSSLVLLCLVAHIQKHPHWSLAVLM